MRMAGDWRSRVVVIGTQQGVVDIDYNSVDPHSQPPAFCASLGAEVIRTAPG